jgi:hypothetical protein
MWNYVILLDPICTAWAGHASDVEGVPLLMNVALCITNEILECRPFNNPLW